MKRLNILTGTFEPSRNPAPPLAVVPDANTVALNSLNQSFTEFSQFIRMEPEERAKREAKPFIEEAQEKANADIAQERQARLAAESEASRIATEKQSILKEHDDAAQRLRDLISVSEQRVSSLSAEADLLRGHLSQAQEDNFRLQNQKKEAPPQPQVITVVKQPDPLTANDIQFDYHRNVTGLLTHVSLKAKGYADTVVEIHRGSDNRMRKLKVR